MVTSLYLMLNMITSETRVFCSVGLSHLREHKFRHNFEDSLDPFCNDGRHTETTFRFFLYCSIYKNQRKTLFEKISNIKCSLLNQNDATVVETFLFGSNSLNDEENTLMTEWSIKCIITTERSIALLLWFHFSIFSVPFSIFQLFWFGDHPLTIKTPMAF